MGHIHAVTWYAGEIRGHQHGLGPERDAGDVESLIWKNKPNKEILLCLENLDGITSKVRSDHILNLLPEIHGRLPEDRDHMCEAVRNFLGLDPRERLLYQVGRRLGIFDGLLDMQDEGRRGIATANVQKLGITPENCDQILDDLIRRFV